MKRIHFYGSSDDTFGWDIPAIDPGDDYDNCANGTAIVWQIRSKSEGALNVVGMYAPKGGHAPCWVIGIQQTGDEAQLPLWRTEFHNHPDCRYSPQLRMDIPDDATLHCLSAKKERKP